MYKKNVQIMNEFAWITSRVLYVLYYTQVQNRLQPQNCYLKIHH